MSPEKNLKDKHTLYITLQCILNYLHFKILKKKREWKHYNKTNRISWNPPYSTYGNQTRIEKAIPLFSHTALSEEENLAGSWMDLCNVKQNELVDGKDRFCIVGLYLDDTEPKLGTGVELVAKTRRDSNSLLITLKMYNKQFFSGMVNLQDQLRDTSYCIVDSKVPYHSHLVSL